MKADYIRNILMFIFMIGLLSQFSCVKDEDLSPPPRIFRPVAEVDNTFENTLIVYFKSIEDAEIYEGDISKDSSFQVIEQSIIIDPDTSTAIIGTTKYTFFLFKDLLAAQEYFIRIKAIHSDSLMNSGYFEIKTTTKSIFVNPTSSEILDVAFKAKWDVGGEIINKITVRLTEDDSFVGDYWVLDDENISGVKVIDGLDGNTSYTIYLYSRNRLRGKGFVTTKAKIEGNIVDLRFMASNTALWDTIQNVESGAIVLLKRGQKYIFPSARKITGSITIMSGYDFAPELAEIQLNGNAFSTPLNSSIDEIVFRDINVNSNYLNASYFFFLEELATIKTVKFDNVHSSGHRGFFRTGPNVSVDSLIIENCIIDSCREYGLTHISGSNSTIKNVITKNSTFYWIVRPHFNSSVAVNSSNTIVHENVTFYNTPDGGRYFFDYNVGTEVTFKNCIFGRTRPLEVATDTTNGIKPNSVNITSQGSYITNDYIINPLTAMPGLIAYPKSSYDLFEDPDKHNFKIKDIGFSGNGTAGDPRWW